MSTLRLCPGMAWILELWLGAAKEWRQVRPVYKVLVWGGCALMECTCSQQKLGTCVCLIGTAQGSIGVWVRGLCGWAVSGNKHPGGGGCSCQFCTDWSVTHKHSYLERERLCLTKPNTIWALSSINNRCTMLTTYHVINNTHSFKDFTQPGLLQPPTELSPPWLDELCSYDHLWFSAKKKSLMWGESYIYLWA